MTSESGIVILGMHRSGTSLTAEIVSRWGAYGNKVALHSADDWNPHGYWEYRPLVQFNEELLQVLGASWMTPPDDGARLVLADLALHPELRARALGLVEEMKAGGIPWFWKDPRLPVLLPFWKRIWGKAAYLVSVRDPGDIARSIERRDGAPAGASLVLWHRYMWEIVTDEEVRREALFVSYEELIARPGRECARICRFLDERLGVEPPVEDPRPERMAEAVAPGLWRSRSGVALAENPLASETQKALYRELTACAAGAPCGAVEKFAPEPHWHGYLAALERMRPRREAGGNSCQVFWRDRASHYEEERSFSTPVRKTEGRQWLRLTLPHGMSGGRLWLRLDVSQEAGFAVIHRLAVRDAAGRAVWEWDGTEGELEARPRNQMEALGARPDGGCQFELTGADPWIELELDETQAAALAGGGEVEVECEYSSHVEYLLATVRTMLAEWRALEADVVRRLEFARQDALETVARIEHEAGRGLRAVTDEQGRAAARLEETAALLERAAERIERAHEGLRAMEERIAGLDRRQAEAESSAAARLREVEAELRAAREAGEATGRRLAELLATRSWRALAAVERAVGGRRPPRDDQ